MKIRSTHLVQILPTVEMTPTSSKGEILPMTSEKNQSLALSYLRRWRKICSQAASIALQSSSEGSGTDNLVSNQAEAENTNSQSEGFGPSVGVSESLEPSQSDVDSPVEGNSNSDQTDELCDLDSDFGYNAYVLTDSESAQEDEVTLQETLASWASTSKCGSSKLNELIGILWNEGVPLPKDSRTLLGTPRSIPTEEKCGGQYIYLGITSSVVNIIKQNTAFLDNPNSVDLVVNIDGINLFKASPSQLWPIICTFSDFEPFVVALYYGTSKPDSVDDYLADFLAEYTQLQENEIVVNGKEINVQIKALLAALKLDPDLNGNPPFHPSFNTYSGLQLPGESSDSPDVWEIHLCNCFLNGLKPDIASAVTSACIVWNNACLSKLRRHAIHAHDQILSKIKKKEETTQKELHMAAITMYNTVREHGQPRYEHRGKECGQHKNWERKTPNDVCFLCGQLGHWKRDCHRNTSSNLSRQVGLKMDGGVGERWTPADKPSQLVGPENGTAPHKHTHTHAHTH
ncbi:hypothetical protein ABVT39_011142 [Epinephelus coioides]